MNTDLLTALENALPKYAAWIVIAALCVPYVTRAFYALSNGRGLVGMLHGIFFGTNTPPNLVANVNANSDAVLKTAKSVVQVVGDNGPTLTNSVIAPLTNQPKVNL